MPSRSDTAVSGDQRREWIADTAYHIDKCCTGGTPEDFTAAEAIVDNMVRAIIGPLAVERDRLKSAIEDYLLWRPGEKGHAAAHKALREALNGSEDTDG